MGKERNPRGRENLKPFAKGDDPRRNLKGRPHKIPEIEELLAEALGSERDGKTAAQKILEAIVAKAQKGDVRAAEMLLDRAYGKAKQAVDVTSAGQRISGFQSLEDAFWKDVEK